MLILKICPVINCCFLTEVKYNDTINFLSDYLKTDDYKIYSKHEYDKTTGFEISTYDITSNIEKVIIMDEQKQIELKLNGHIQISVRHPYRLHLINYIRF